MTDGLAGSCTEWLSWVQEVEEEGYGMVGWIHKSLDDGMI